MSWNEAAQILFPTAPNWYAPHVADANENFIYVGCNNVINVIEVSTRRIVGTLRGHAGRVVAVKLVKYNDTQALVTCGTDKTVRLWCLRTFTEISQHTKHSADITAITSLENCCITGDKRGKLILWTYGVQTQVNSSQTVSVTALQSWGNVIGVGYLSGQVQILDEKLNLVHNLGRHKSEVQTISFNNFDGRLASVSKDEILYVWSVEGAELLSISLVDKKTNNQHTKGNAQDRRFTACTWSPSATQPNSIFFTGGKGGELLHIDVSTKKKSRVPHKFGHSRPTFQLCPAGPNNFVSVSMDRKIVLWTLADQSKGHPAVGQWQLCSLGGHVMSLARSDNQLLSACGDGMMRILDLNYKERREHANCIWRGLLSPAKCLVAHPHVPGLFAYGLDDGHIGVVYVNEDNNIYPEAFTLSTGHPKAVTSLTWVCSPRLEDIPQAEDNQEADNVADQQPEKEEAKSKGKGKSSKKNNESKSKLQDCLIFGDKLLSVSADNKKPTVLQVSEKASQINIEKLHMDNPILASNGYIISAGPSKVEVIDCNKPNTYNLTGISGTHISAVDIIDGLLMVGTSTGNIHWFLMDKEKQMFSCVGELKNVHSGHITCVRWQPQSDDGGCLYAASVSADGSAKIFEVERGANAVRQIKSFPDGSIEEVPNGVGPLFTCEWALSPCKKKYNSLVLGGQDQTIFLWHTPSQQPKWADHRLIFSKDKKVITRRDSKDENVPLPAKKATTTPVTLLSACSQTVHQQSKRSALISISRLVFNNPDKLQKSLLQNVTALNDFIEDKSIWEDSVDQLLFTNNRDFADRLLSKEINARQTFSSRERFLKAWTGDFAGAMTLGDQLPWQESDNTAGFSDGGNAGLWLSLAAQNLSQQAMDELLQHIADNQNPNRDPIHIRVLQLLATNEISKAIDLYINQSLFSEACLLARLRFPTTHPIIRKCYLMWAKNLTDKQMYEQAAKCYIFTGEKSLAINMLRQRLPAAGSDLSKLKTSDCVIPLLCILLKLQDDKNMTNTIFHLLLELALSDNLSSAINLMQSDSFRSFEHSAGKLFHVWHDLLSNGETDFNTKVIMDVSSNTPGGILVQAIQSWSQQKCDDAILLLLQVKDHPSAEKISKTMLTNILAKDWIKDKIDNRLFYLACLRSNSCTSERDALLNLCQADNISVGLFNLHCAEIPLKQQLESIKSTFTINNDAFDDETMATAEKLVNHMAKTFECDYDLSQENISDLQIMSMLAFWRSIPITAKSAAPALIHARKIDQLLTIIEDAATSNVQPLPIPVLEVLQWISKNDPDLCDAIQLFRSTLP